jgi:hypothetical protein
MPELSKPWSNGAIDSRWINRYGPGVRFWLRVFAVAFSTAALLGAAQLGLAYGLSAIRFDRSFSGAENDWNIQLTWTVWFAMIAVVGGTAFAMSDGKLLARRVGIASRHTDGAGVTLRLIAAAAAGIGALLAMMPLTVYPAISAKIPPLDAGITMALNVGSATVVAIVVAAVTVANRPLSSSMVVFTVAAWVLAIVSALNTLPLMGRLYLDPVRLGVLDIGALQPEPRAYFTMPVLALVLGTGVALVSRMRRHPRVLTAVSGATGPLLIALAYLMGGPGISRDLTNQAQAYLGAMIAVVVGLVPSVIVALLPPRKKQVL